MKTVYHKLFPHEISSGKFSLTVALALLNFSSVVLASVETFHIVQSCLLDGQKPFWIFLIKLRDQLMSVC